MSKPRRVHLELLSTGSPFCMTVTMSIPCAISFSTRRNFLTTDDYSKVTCKNCISQHRELGSYVAGNENK